MQDVELSDGESKKPTKSMVRSDAWPKEVGVQNEAKSDVHQFIRDHCDQINVENVYYRRLTVEDI
jgi:hypothetical protein